MGDRHGGVIYKHESACELAVLLREIRAANKDESLSAKINRCYEIANAQEDFVESSVSPESNLQKYIVEETHKDPKAGSLAIMLSGHLVGQLLKMVAEMVKAERVLEIGMFTGYSAVTLGSSAFCEEVVSLDIDPYMEKFVKARIKGTPLEEKIRIIIGPAIESLVTLKAEGNGFDLVYIDADKTGYLGYYKYIMDNGLLNANGCILCDNIMWYNDTILDRKSSGGKALFEFVKFVKKDDRVDQIVFPLRDGVMLIKQKFH